MEQEAVSVLIQSTVNVVHHRRANQIVACLLSLVALLPTMVSFLRFVFASIQGSINLQSMLSLLRVIEEEEEVADC